MKSQSYIKELLEDAELDLLRTNQKIERIKSVNNPTDIEEFRELGVRKAISTSIIKTLKVILEI